MAANRFDQLLPLQLIPRESLYVPFRIKDNSDIYSKLFSSLSNKSKGSGKITDAKLYEEKIGTSNLSHKTSAIGEGEVHSAFNLPFLNLESAIHAKNKELVDRSLATLMANSEEGELDANLVLQHNKIVNDANNNKQLQMLRTSYEFYKSQIESIAGANPETQADNYKNLAVLEASLYNGILYPNIIFTKEDNTTFNDLTKKYIEDIKAKSIEKESYLSPAHTLGIPNRMILGGTLDLLFVESTKEATKGSYYNPSLDNIDELTNIRKKMYQAEEAYSFNKLTKMGGNRIYNDDPLRQYNNYAQLLAYIESDIKGAVPITGDINNHIQQVQLYKNTASQIKGLMEKGYNYSNLEDNEKESILRLINQNPEIAQMLKTNGINLENINGKTLLDIKNIFNTKYTELRNGLNQFYEKNKNNLNKVREEENKLRNNFLNLVKSYDEFQKIVDISKNRYMINFLQSEEIEYIDENGQVVKKKMNGLEKDISSALIYDQIYRAEKREINRRDLKNAIGLFTDQSYSLTRETDVVSAKIDNKDSRGGNASGGGGDIEDKGSFLFNITPMAQTFDDSVVTNYDRLNLPLQKGNDINNKVKNLLPSLLNISDDSESSNNIHNISFGVRRNQNGEIIINIAAHKNSDISSPNKESIITQKDYYAKIDESGNLIFSDSQDYQNKTATEAFNSLIKLSGSSVGDSNINTFINQVKLITTVNEALREKNIKSSDGAFTPQQVFAKNLKNFINNENDATFVFIYKDKNGDVYERFVPFKELSRDVSFDVIDTGERVYNLSNIKLIRNIRSKNGNQEDNIMDIIITKKAGTFGKINISDHLRAIFDYGQYEESSGKDYFININYDKAIRYINDIRYRK